MKTIKSLRTVKWVLPLVVAVFGMAIAFAVRASNMKNNKDGSLQLQEPCEMATHYWVRVNCNATDPQIEIVTEGTNFQEAIEESAAPELTGNFTNCEGFGNICAVLYPCSDLEFVPGSTTNLQLRAGAPTPGEASYSKAFCD